MTTSTWTIGDNRLAAIYSNRDAVVQAKKALLSKSKIKPEAVKLIEPDGDAAAHKLEGDSKSIGRNLLIWHLVYGALGLGIGLVIGWLLVNFGPEFTRLNPIFTYIAMLSPGLFIGLFFSGLVSLKPHHDPLNQAAIRAKEQNDWTLIVKLDEQNVAKKEVLPIIEQTGAKKIL